jgi:hypothetical protein
MMLVLQPPLGRKALFNRFREESSPWSFSSSREGARAHDTIEEIKATDDELESAFGTAVPELVREVTDHNSLNKVTRKQLQNQNCRRAFRPATTASNKISAPLS